MANIQTMSQLNSQTSSNYNVAREYYRQRRENLSTLFNKDVDSLMNTLIDYINNKIQEYDEKVYKKVYELLDKVDNNAWQVSPSTLHEVNSNEEYSMSVRQVINFLAGGKATYKSNQNVAAALGNEFESFLERALLPESLFAALGPEIAEQLNAIISLLGSGFSSTGSKKSTAWNVTGSKNIRPDLGLNMDMTYTDDEGALRLADSNLHVELQEILDLDIIDPTDIGSNEILQAYLGSNAYGFSLKIWKSSQSKEFTQSKIIQSYVNNKFQEGRKRRRTWESTYTNEYVVWQLSKLLINIIGPMNVGVITGKQFIWMDDFVSRRLFYMDVQMQNNFHKTSSRGPGIEGFPEIPNPSIKIRELKNDVHAFRTSVSRSTGRISIRNRNIKT